MRFVLLLSGLMALFPLKAGAEPLNQARHNSRIEQAQQWTEKVAPVINQQFPQSKYNRQIENARKWKQNDAPRINQAFPSSKYNSTIRDARRFEPRQDSFPHARSLNRLDPYGRIENNLRR